MTSPTLVRMPDGTDIDGSSLTCEGCGSDLAGHSCGGAAGSTGSITYSRSTGTRKPVSAHPTCPHCGGRIHFNMGGSAINAECLNRQYSLDTGSMTDPNARLPVLTLERMEDIVEWAKTLSTPPSYGKMESAAGGAGTYSGLRVKTGRKKKVAPAAPGAQIQDMAADETVEGEEPVKAKKSRKGTAKGKSEAPVEGVIREYTPEEEAEALARAEDPGNGSEPYDVAEQAAEEMVADAETVAAAGVQGDEAEQARRERAERRAARKAVLSGKVG